MNRLPEFPTAIDSAARQADSPSEAGGPTGKHSAGGRYLDRDESDLAYIRRIAARGGDVQVPLIERLRFLEIAEAVLDEFVAVRLCKVDSALRHEIRSGVAALRRKLLGDLEKLMPRLRQAGLSLAAYGGGDPPADGGLHDAFSRTLLPGLTPLTVDEEHPFPQLLHGQRALLLELEGPGGDGRPPLIVPISPALASFMKLSDGTWIRSDRLLRLCAAGVVQDQPIAAMGLIRVLRLNDLSISSDFRSLRDEVERGLEERPRNPVIAIDVDDEAPQHLVDFAAAHIFGDAPAADRCVCAMPWDAVGALEGLRRIVENEGMLAGERFEPLEKKPLREVLQHDGDLFAAMTEGDFLLHSPYQSFEAFSQLLWQAAHDESVVAIRQTLYRTEGSVVEHLLEAARRGKDVTVVVEIEARENERQNIALSQALERAGAHIVHGIVGLKVHAKLLHIVRQENGALREYAAFSTGNFHAGNAASYGDLTLFTAEPALTADLRRLMNYVTGHLPTPGCEHLVVAPKDLRDALIGRIRREADNARAGRASGVWFKVNSLLDKKVVDALYDAAQAGVPVRGCVRRHCALRPDVPGLSPGIEIRSLIGRFLEHARVICFANGSTLPSEDAEVFIASADWMPRNFDDRVEVLVPVLDKTLRKRLIEYYMPAYLEDDTDSWRLDGDGHYERLRSSGKSAQAAFLDRPLA